MSTSKAIATVATALFFHTSFAAYARPSLETPSIATGVEKTTHEHSTNAACEKKTAESYMICADTCGDSGVAEFSSDTCGSNTKCVCGVTTDEDQLVPRQN